MSDPFKLIAIVGMPGAGKTIAADFFRHKGVPVLRFGDQTDIGLRELGKPLTEANERWYREKLRSDLGMAAMAIKIEPRILKESEHSILIVLDGLYSWEEYLYLKEKFPQLLLLSVYAPPGLRHSRLSKRPVRPLAKQEAVSRDKAEIENLNKAGPIAIADYLVRNNTTVNALHANLEKLYKVFV